jgi:hypothetical protein
MGSYQVSWCQGGKDRTWSYRSQKYVKELVLQHRIVLSNKSVSHLTLEFVRDTEKEL